MMEDELRTLGITVQRQKMGEPIGSNGWNIHAMLIGTGRDRRTDAADGSRLRDPAALRPCFTL